LLDKRQRMLFTQRSTRACCSDWIIGEKSDDLDSLEPSRLASSAASASGKGVDHRRVAQQAGVNAVNAIGGAHEGTSPGPQRVAVATPANAVG